jgi:RNA polymerase sigma factor (sigma-70 family)
VRVSAPTELTDVDRAEFEALWEANYRAIRDACARWMGGRELGDEACARVALDALQKFARYRAMIRDPRGWLMAVGRSVCMDVHRELTRERRVIGPSMDSAAHLVFSSTTPERNLLHAERLERVSRAVAALPAPLRRTLELRVVQERSYGEIAAHLGLTEPNVRKRLQQARAELRAYEKAERHRTAIPPVPRRAEERQRLWRLSVPPVTGSDGTVHDSAFFAEAKCSTRSLAWLEHYTAVHPRGWTHHLERARILRDAGQTADAVDAMRAILARQPHNMTVALELAALHAACAEPHLAAETCLRTARALRGPRARRLEALASRYRGCGADAAASLATLGMLSVSVDPWLEAAASWTEAADAASAFAALDHAASLDPTDVRVALARAGLLQQVGDQERAFAEALPLAARYVVAAEIAIVSGIAAGAAPESLRWLLAVVEPYRDRAASVEACAAFDLAAGAPEAAKARVRAFRTAHPRHVHDRFTAGEP